MKPNLMHALTRTSPKGQPFVGTCMKCGKAGLTLQDQHSDECPNPSGMSPEQTLRHAIMGRDKL